MCSAMTEKKTKIIVFDFDNDNRPMRESVAEGKLFEPQYQQALRQIDTYLGELELEKTEEEENRERNNQRGETEFIADDIDYNNNIFSFVGGRGTGKTSCMISVASMLQDEKGKIDRKEYPNIEKIKFTTIDLIDPAYFDKSHNLMSLFLAKLYKKFMQVVEKDEKGQMTRSEKQHFFQCYRDAHSQLHRLYHERDKEAFSDEDLMEYVEEVSASVKLKRTIQDLVDSYLKCTHHNDTILILRVDDVDMDFDHASEMVETMRKYFVQPNLLVFVSCDIEQLEKIKRADFKKNLPGKQDEEWCKELAEKYLAKVFPHSHLIQMPSPASYHDYKLRIKACPVTEAGRAVKDENNDRLEAHDGKKVVRDFVSVKQAVLELILKKTRYLFYNTSYYESYMVPRNLRELRQLMKLLITMPDYYADGHEHPHNKTLFKEYFFKTWVRTNLQVKDQETVKGLLDVHDHALLNEVVMDIVGRRFMPGYQKDQARKLPISTSDVLAQVSSIEPTLVKESDRKLLFFIKSYYSILFYDNYCELRAAIAANNNKCPEERRDSGVEGNFGTTIVRRDAHSEFFDFEKLAGGIFMQLPNTQELALTATKFRDYVNTCKGLLDKDEITPEEESKILLAELLILSIHYSRQSSQLGVKVDIYEQLKHLPEENGATQLVISVGALLFNITHYERSIRRYDPEFFEKVEKVGKDGYNSLWKRIADKENITDDFQWIHRVALRNFEVMQDVLIGYDGLRQTTAFDQYIHELKYLSGYSFPLYEYVDGKDKYNLLYLKFFEPVVKGIETAIKNTGEIKNILANSGNDNNENHTGINPVALSEPAQPAATDGTKE